METWWPWVRPPLIGQSSSTEASSRYVQPLSNQLSPSPDSKHSTPETIPEEQSESQENLPERKTSSPTSSIASHKPLEWDSGADVGYYNILPHSKQNNKKLSTIERMALARGCSAALRLDPEGTTESGLSGRLSGTQRNSKLSLVPDANSTPLLGNISGSESEIEITPIVKNHLPGIITGSDIKSNEKNSGKDVSYQEIAQTSRKDQETPKSSFPFKMPLVKYPTEGKRIKSRQITNKENLCPPPTSPLKKSTSMNTIFIAPSIFPLKRSQSEFNLNARDKPGIPLIFNSSSSIATIVNKPSTCDKLIQTSLNAFTQESIGVQVSVLEEEKPPLPKRGTSLQKNLTSILKNPKGTYRVKNSKTPGPSTYATSSETAKEMRPRRNSSEASQNESATQTPQPDENIITGRANSFEYFPGHIYENVSNGSGSHISSSETGRSNSTLPNTSSSINEKLWGDSDSLVRDLERSVNILKSLVDANKCDKEVKKRLIHHVVKRLVTAKYTDDKIEHNLEDNVPWNPDDARSKVYRTEILQALTKKHSTTDSSDDWNSQKKSNTREYVRKPLGNSRDVMKDVGALGSSNESDKFDKNTDRTETDGRKARMGVRTDNCHRNASNTPTDPDKSESSECFLPQRGCKTTKVQDIFIMKEKCKIPREDSTTTATTNGTPPDHNRMLLEAVVNNRRTAIRSSNNSENVDWRLLTTMSERQFHLKKCSNSDSGDSKLVSYAEMEKRNQLTWITNEISHLCNLKKLLEQPRKVERPRASPRKSKSAKPMSSTARGHASTTNKGAITDYLDRNLASDVANSVDEPWSSHCNLAVCQQSRNGTTDSVIQRIKKRNSCAQTATNVTSAHSKTGGEIVSASNRQSYTIKLVNSGAQTETIPTLIQSEIVHYIKCPAHKTVMRFTNSCKCNEQNSCHCLKHAIRNVLTCVECSQEQSQQEQPQQVVASKVQKEDRPTMSTQTPLNRTNDSSVETSNVIHRCTSREGSQFKQKETKNQINASKSKFTCDCKSAHNCQCVDEYKHGSSDAENKATGCKRPFFKVCQSCSTQISSSEACNVDAKREECQKKLFYTRGEKKEGISKDCACTNACNCENDRSKKSWGAPIGTSSKYYRENNERASSFGQNGSIKLCECSADSSCENNREPGLRSAKMFCDCFSASNGNDQQNGVRYYGHYAKLDNRQVTGHHQYKAQNGIKCLCEKDCFCSNQLKGVVKEKSRNRAFNKAKYTDETNGFDSERNRKFCRHCGTAYQNARKCKCYQTYPKAVAYELSFVKENNRKNDKNSDVPSKIPAPNPSGNGGKVDGCACNTINRNGSNKNAQQNNTLQDYLSRNKPDFLGNAETRRQYITEISHLRQLRKEKRIQLLAMASTCSSIMKFPKNTSKPAVRAPKKMTDEEMRKRLRKRYLRLNEVRSKKRQREKQEEARRNKLMAKIFGKKLQQKVLKGHVDLSQSVSVISNM